MAKNLILGPTVAHLVQIWAQKIFFVGFTSKVMLDIVVSYHCIQFQGKLMIQNQENGENLGPLGRIQATKIVFQKSVFVTIYYGLLSSCTIS